MTAFGKRRRGHHQLRRNPVDDIRYRDCGKGAPSGSCPGILGVVEA